MSQLYAIVGATLLLCLLHATLIDCKSSAESSEEDLRPRVGVIAQPILQAVTMHEQHRDDLDIKRLLAQLIAEQKAAKRRSARGGDKSKKRDEDDKEDDEEEEEESEEERKQRDDSEEKSSRLKKDDDDSEEDGGSERKRDSEEEDKNDNRERKIRRDIKRARASPICILPAGAHY